MATQLTTLLRSCTEAERHQLAQLAGTSVNYLYSLAGCHRERVNVKLALAIEDASVVLNAETLGLTPIITARQLSTMCTIAPFDEVTAE